MVHKCCISSCGMSVRVVGAKGLTYHLFPTKEPNREKWIQAILPHVEKPDAFKIVQGYTRVCSKHFKKKDYSIDSRKRARLSSNAVPTLFPERKESSNGPILSSSNVEIVGDALAEIKINLTPQAPPKNPHFSMCSEPLVVNSLVDSESRRDEMRKVEQELLQSIQAVSINSREKDEGDVSSELDSFSSLLDNTLGDSLDHPSLQDLYNELVNGGASLSLEDTSFDSQVLIDALSSEAGSEESNLLVEQLVHDLNSSLLNDLSSSPSCNGKEIGLHSTTLLSDYSNSTQDLISPFKKPKPPVAAFGDFAESSSSRGTSEASEAELDRPSKTRKKQVKKEKAQGNFSVERFKESNKDIEYYTGFQSFTKFETFFRSLDAYVENLKVTDMMRGVANLGTKTSTDTKRDMSPDDVRNSGVVVVEEQRRRLSQGRSMSRIDELFMTVIRLRRKIPEKVLGHMFCISQPTVSRIIRAWTMLLSKVLELPPPQNDSSSPPLPLTLNTQDSAPPPSVQIPNSFRQLFVSDLAQTIISSSTTNSRKTSSSTSCSNNLRSKRPKKEKIIASSTEQLQSVVKVKNNSGKTTADFSPPTSSTPNAIKKEGNS